MVARAAAYTACERHCGEAMPTGARPVSFDKGDAARRFARPALTDLPLQPTEPVTEARVVSVTVACWLLPVAEVQTTATC